MSDVLATIVVEFGEGVDSTALVVVELDDAVNRDSEGKPTSSFHPGDEPGFVVHYDPAALRIDRVKCSSGMVIDNGPVSRVRKQQVQFVVPGKPVSLPHIPASGVSVDWYGNAPTISQAGRQLTASGILPAIGQANYSINCHAYRLAPPPMSLAENESYPVLIVVYMEAA